MGLWQNVWISNKDNSISGVWQAVEKEGALIMNDSTKSWRIIFYDITPESFLWKYESFIDGEWKMVSRIKAALKT